MRLLRFFIPILFLFAACSKKGYLDRSNEDRALLDAVKKLSKNPDDESASEAVPILYKSIKQTHLAKIQSYNTIKDLTRYDKIIGEYQLLQNAYDAIMDCTPAFKLVKPENYSTPLDEMKSSAASEYYNLGDSALAKEGRANAKIAYTYFSKAAGFVPNYKETAAKMQRAIDKAMVNVIVYPVQDNSIFSSGGWNNLPYGSANDNMQKNLIQDMGGKNEKRYPARFYSDREAYRENIKPDWIVDMLLRELDVPYPANNSYSRNVSKQITVGTDTVGLPIYQTVYATVRINRANFTAKARMEVTVKDVVNKTNVSNNSYVEDYRWEQETATYTGDSRALSAADWDLINRSGFAIPAKDFVLNELYKQLYPRIRNQVRSSVEW